MRGDEQDRALEIAQAIIHKVRYRAKRGPAGAQYWDGTSVDDCDRALRALDRIRHPENWNET